MTRTAWTCLGSLAVVTVCGPWGAGCSSSSANQSQPDAEPAGDGGVPDSAEGLDAGMDAVGMVGDADAAPSGLTLRWSVVVQTPPFGSGEPDASAARAPLAGVSVCVNGMAAIPCATTDATGIFTLTGLVPSTNIVLTATKTGYRSVAAPVTTGTMAMDATTTPFAMSSTTDPDPPFGGAIDWTNKGQVLFFAIGMGAIVPDSGPVGDPGAMVSLSPASGTGPVFLTDGNTFDASAPSLIDAAGAFFNVAAGTYALTLSDPTGDCEPISSPFAAWGYPATGHKVTFPVLAGYETTVGMYCSKTTSPASDASAEGAADANGE
jgi:hypothetical protein